MKATAVIGMNYGDEGKGHIIDYLSDAHTLVVRFNGGAQAAHAVMKSDGRNHIFHHFGAGSLNGARTLLSHHFIINPILFGEEFAALSTTAKHIIPQQVLVDPRAIISTPFDMLINSFASSYHKKHDSCGLGINETISRSKFKQLCINMRDLLDKGPDKLMGVLQKIENEYVPWRLEKLKLPLNAFNKYFKNRVADPGRTIEQYISVIKFMLEHVYVWHDSDLIDRFVAKDSKNRHIVFEGAQGMLLDQNRTKYMPFLTRSNTDIRNVISIIRLMKTAVELETILVTRTYFTRHGDGPLKDEFKLPYKKIYEPSNPFNLYQGNMRYGHFQLKWYHKAIDEIFAYQNKNMHKIPGKTPYKGLPDNIADFNVSVAMNCADQVEMPAIKDLKHESRHHPKYLSTGPTEKDINHV